MSGATPRISHPHLRTEDGVDLASDLATVASPRALAVLGHPHPGFGGTRRVTLIEAWFRTLPPSGITTLRFDFRGAGESGGEQTGGALEGLDLAAAMDELTATEDAPLLLAGWSFGAEVMLAHSDPRIAGWLAVAPPAAERPDDVPAGIDERPTLILAPEHDQFAPPEEARRAVEDWRSTTVEIVPGTDHSLTGRVDQVAERTVAFALDL